LGTLEALPAEITLMWLEGDMDSNMRSNMVALDCSGPTKVPPTGKVQVVCALSTDMALADVILGEMSILQLILAKSE
jgi:hypothetical protein